MSIVKSITDKEDHETQLGKQRSIVSTGSEFFINRSVRYYPVCVAIANMNVCSMQHGYQHMLNAA